MRTDREKIIRIINWDGDCRMCDIECEDCPLNGKCSHNSDTLALAKSWLDNYDTKSCFSTYFNDYQTSTLYHLGLYVTKEEYDKLKADYTKLLNSIESLVSQYKEKETK